MKLKITIIWIFITILQTTVLAFNMDSLCLNGYGDINYHKKYKDHNNIYQTYLKFGLQLSGHLSDDLTFTVQESAYKNTKSKIDDEDIFTLELAHLGYRFNDSINIRLGRMQIPTFMFSDILNVSYYYDFTSIQGVYSIIPIKRLNGGEFRYSTDINDHYISSIFFYGKTKVEIYNKTDTNSLVKQDFGYDDDVYGVVVNYEYENFSARSAYVESTVEDNKSFYVLKDKFYYINLGIRYDFEQAYVLGEYIKLDSKVSFPKTSSWYMVLGYDFGKWIPFVSYMNQKSTPKSLSKPSQKLPNLKDLPQGTTLLTDLPQGSIPIKDLPPGAIPLKDLPSGTLPSSNLPEGTYLKNDVLSVPSINVITKSIGLRYNLYENTAIKIQYDSEDGSDVFSASISFVF